MLYMVELHYDEDQREAALEYFDKHGLTHYEQDLVIQNVWVATQDRIAYIVAKTSDERNIEKSVEPLAAFGQVTFRPVISSGQL